MSLGISAAGWAAVGAIGSVGVGLYSANKASSAQQGAAQDANQTQLDMYNQTRADQAPWRTQGEWGLNQLQSNLAAGFNPGDLTQDPGYQFELNQGMQGLDRSAASRGRLYSGAQMKAADTFATNFAGTKYDDAYKRWITGNNQLSNLAGLGQVATNYTDTAAQNYGQQYGNNVTGAANAQASGYLYQGNSLTNALNGVAAYGMRNYQPTPPVANGSDPYGYNGTQNNLSAYVGP